MRKTLVVTAISLISASACSGDEIAPSKATITKEAQHVAASESDNFESELDDFNQEFLGFWRTKLFLRGAWVDLIWVVGRTHAWHVVTAYADEEQTIPLLRWDIVRQYILDEPSTLYANTYEMLWMDRLSTLTPYVDDPGLFAAIGVDDCALQVGETLDTSPNNCGAPLFPFRDCTMMDFVQLGDGLMTFGEPQQGDRCVVRPTNFEEWSFRRVSLTAELWRALFHR